MDTKVEKVYCKDDIYTSDDENALEETKVTNPSKILNQFHIYSILFFTKTIKILFCVVHFIFLHLFLISKNPNVCLKSPLFTTN